MSLKTILRKSGYDLIDGPIRNHKILQLWLKQPGNPPTIYYQHILHALTSSVILEEFQDEALRVNHRHKETYSFNIGITVLDNILTALGLGSLGIELIFNGGKEVAISYGESKTVTVGLGDIQSFLNTSDFTHPNKGLLRNANRSRIVLINSILMAKNLRSTITSNQTISADVIANLNNQAEGQATFTRTKDATLEMNVTGNAFIPIAVQAHRLDWDNGTFDRMSLITDDRNIF